MGVIEELAHLLASHRIKRSRTTQMVDEEAVPLIRGNPTCAGMGLRQVTVPFQSRHIRPDGGRGNADARGVHHVLGPNRLGRADVFGDHRVENGRFPDIQRQGVGTGPVVSAVVAGLHGWLVASSESHQRSGAVGIGLSARWHSILLSADPARASTFRLIHSRVRPNAADGHPERQNARSDRSNEQLMGHGRTQSNHRVTYHQRQRTVGRLGLNGGHGPWHQPVFAEIRQ